MSASLKRLFTAALFTLSIAIWAWLTGLIFVFIFSGFRKVPGIQAGIFVGLVCWFTVAVFSLTFGLVTIKPTVEKVDYEYDVKGDHVIFKKEPKGPIHAEWRFGHGAEGSSLKLKQLSSKEFVVTDGTKSPDFGENCGKYINVLYGSIGSFDPAKAAPHDNFDPLHWVAWWVWWVLLSIGWIMVWGYTLGKVKK